MIVSDFARNRVPKVVMHRLQICKNLRQIFYIWVHKYGRTLYDVFDFDLCTFVIQIHSSFYKWQTLFLASFSHYYIPCDKYLLYLQIWRYSKNLAFSLSISTHLCLVYMQCSSFKLLVLLVTVICDDFTLKQINQDLHMPSIIVSHHNTHMYMDNNRTLLSMSGFCRGVTGMISGILCRVAKYYWHSSWTVDPWRWDW